MPSPLGGRRDVVAGAAMVVRRLYRGASTESPSDSTSRLADSSGALVYPQVDTRRTSFLVADLGMVGNQEEVTCGSKSGDSVGVPGERVNVRSCAATSLLFVLHGMVSGTARKSGLSPRTSRRGLTLHAGRHPQGASRRGGLGGGDA